ncbi:hypothetical protein [Pedobacter agri]|nr:hypothetical protein [Pedobacter agri]
MKTTYLQYGLKLAKNLRDERNFIGKFQQTEFTSVIEYLFMEKM